MGLALFDEFFNLDFIAQHIARTGQVLLEFDGRIQQAIGSLSLDHMIDTQVGAKKKIRLTGLNRNTNRCPSAVQIPGLRLNIVFRNDFSRF